MRRLRRLLRWLLPVALCIVLLAWALSMLSYYGVVVECGGRQYAIKTMPNQFGIGVDPGRTHTPGFFAIRVRQIQPMSWWIDRVRIGTPNSPFLYIPFWIPALVLGAFTAWLWMTDRRQVPDGCAECGYPIGTSDVCTECGAKVR